MLVQIIIQNLCVCVCVCVCLSSIPYIIGTKYPHKDGNIWNSCPCVFFWVFFCPHEENSLYILREFYWKCKNAESVLGWVGLGVGLWIVPIKHENKHVSVLIGFIRWDDGQV